MKSLIVEFATFLGVQLTDRQIQLYADWIKREMSEDMFRLVRTKYIKEKLHSRFSNEQIAVTLAQLVEMAKDRPDIESQAVQVANAIIDGVSRYGWPNGAEAKEALGELAWRVVEERGGWVNLCKNLKTSELKIAFAHFRDSAKAIQKRAQAGALHEKPTIAGEEKIDKLIKATKLKAIG